MITYTGHCRDSGLVIFLERPPGLEDGISLCLGVNTFGRDRETHSKQIKRRGLYEEPMGQLDKTRPVDSTQEEPGVRKSPCKSYFFA